MLLSRYQNRPLREGRKGVHHCTAGLIPQHCFCPGSHCETRSATQAGGGFFFSQARFHSSIEKAGSIFPAL